MAWSPDPTPGCELLDVRTMQDAARLAHEEVGRHGRQGYERNDSKNERAKKRRSVGVGGLRLDHPREMPCLR